MDAEVLDIMSYHEKNFEKGKDGRWTYYPNNKHCLGDLDVDRLDVFYLRNYFKELGYETMKEVWWQVPGMSLEVGLRRLHSDNELREMCCQSGKNNGIVDVYIEHGISELEILQRQDVVVHVDDQVRDLEEQIKSNVRTVKNPPLKPTTEKDPPMSLSIITYKPQVKEALPKKINANSKMESKSKPKSKPKPKTVSTAGRQPQPHWFGIRSCLLRIVLLVQFFVDDDRFELPAMWLPVPLIGDSYWCTQQMKKETLMERTRLRRGRQSFRV